MHDEIRDAEAHSRAAGRVAVSFGFLYTAPGNRKMGTALEDLRESEPNRPDADENDHCKRLDIKYSARYEYTVIEVEDTR